MSIKVKICGLTNAEDAEAAASAGADLVGFVFCESSPRYIDPRVASEICRGLPLHVVRVGLFVNAPPDEVFGTVSLCGLQMCQFHGEETPEYCLQFGVMSMKAFRMADRSVLARMESYRTDAWLLDSFVAGKEGGTGQQFDWELAIEARGLGRPIFLAGGLAPENVADAVQRVRPYGVDVSSGVELSPGRKDPRKVRAFIEAARRAAATESPAG